MVIKCTVTVIPLLRKEIGKDKRHEPVRELLTRASQAIQELKLCFMMSPWSLAKFAGNKGLRFDLLVIDGASWSAGAAYDYSRDADAQTAHVLSLLLSFTFGGSHEFGK